MGKVQASGLYGHTGDNFMFYDYGDTYRAGLRAVQDTFLLQ